MCFSLHVNHLLVLTKLISVEITPATESVPQYHCWKMKLSKDWVTNVLFAKLLLEIHSQICLNVIKFNTFTEHPTKYSIFRTPCRYWLYCFYLVSRTYHKINNILIFWMWIKQFILGHLVITITIVTIV